MSPVLSWYMSGVSTFYINSGHKNNLSVSPLFSLDFGFSVCSMLPFPRCNELNQIPGLAKFMC